MIVKFISTEGEALEAKIEIDNKVYCVMDSFSTDDLKNGSTISIGLYVGLENENETWEDIFSGNINKESKIESLGGWKYKVFGKIISINPTIVDCDVCLLEISLQSNDSRIVNEYISFTVERLDAIAED